MPTTYTPPASQGRDKPLLWLLPLGSLLVFFYIYPLVDLVRLSFTNVNLLRPDFSYTFSSYVNLFSDPDFYRTMGITFLYVAATVASTVVLGLALAVAIDAGARRGILSSLVSRTTVLLGWAIPGVIAGLIWRLMLNESNAGIINYLLSFLGIANTAFLSNPRTAIVVLIIATVWRNVAFNMILFYGGLQTVPEDILEYATIDGANGWQRLMKISIPYILPQVVIMLITGTIAAMNRFDIVISLTGGGPGRSTEVIALSIYSRVFREFSIGRGSALATVLLLVNVAMATAYYRIIRRREQ